MNPKVDFYFNKAKKWQAEQERLRDTLLDCGLTEELKWGVPCYTFQGSNIVLIHAFKEYCSLLFHKGVLLKDTESVLIQQTKNVQSARQMRFTALEQVKDMQQVIRAYVYEAIEVEKAGLKVEMKSTEEYSIPEEFQQQLDENPSLKVAFENLTPGRQRGYLLHFSQAKQSKTRRARVEKCMGLIFEGKGLNDR